MRVESETANYKELNINMVYISHPCYYKLKSLCIRNPAIEKSIIETLNISRFNLQEKINGADDFTDYEAKAISDLLNIKLQDIF